MMPAARTANSAAAANHIPLVSIVFSSLSSEGSSDLSFSLLPLLSIEPSISGRRISSREGYALMHRLLCRRFDCGGTVHYLLYPFEGPGPRLAPPPRPPPQIPRHP